MKMKPNPNYNYAQPFPTVSVKHVNLSVIIPAPCSDLSFCKVAVSVA